MPFDAHQPKEIFMKVSEKSTHIAYGVSLVATFVTLHILNVVFECPMFLSLFLITGAHALGYAALRVLPHYTLWLPPLTAAYLSVWYWLGTTVVPHFMFPDTERHAEIWLKRHSYIRMDRHAHILRYGRHHPVHHQAQPRVFLGGRATSASLSPCASRIPSCNLQPFSAAPCGFGARRIRL